MVDEFCKHDDGTSWRVFRSVPAWNRYARTVMGHTVKVDRLVIRTAAGQAGIGNNDGHIVRSAPTIQ